MTGTRAQGAGELALLEDIVRQAVEDYVRGPQRCLTFKPRHQQQQERLRVYASAVVFLEAADLLERVQAVHQVPPRSVVVQSELTLGE